MNKKTLILGATNNTDRYAFRAAKRLTEEGHEFVPVGVRKGKVLGKEIINVKEKQEDIDTVTLYVSPKNQLDWYDYILETKPKRIIFNPGTENPELQQKADEKGIETLYACTLVMLNTNQY